MAAAATSATATATTKSSSNPTSSVSASQPPRPPPPPPPLENYAFPTSVEEAGALLGAAITKCGREHLPLARVPEGMPRSFATTTCSGTGTGGTSHPSSELLSHLAALRSFLRTHTAAHQQQQQQQQNQRSVSPPSSSELVAVAPSLLAVLMKLVGVSTSIANRVASAQSSSVSAGASTAAASSSFAPTTTATTNATTVCLDVPPLSSTPLRNLWVDCVVLCHVLGCSSSSSSSSSSTTTKSTSSSVTVLQLDATQCLRQMSDLASVHPRSSRAAGGVRIAALQVVGQLFRQPQLASNKLGPWTLEVLQLCQRCVRSAGNGEPTLRAAALRTARAAAVAARDFELTKKKRKRKQQSQQQHGGDVDDNTAAAREIIQPEWLVLQSYGAGNFDDKAVSESMRMIKYACADKFPEIRAQVAQFASCIVPLLIHPPNSPEYPVATSSLDELLALALRNIDDEFPHVASLWSETVARCLCTAVQYNLQTNKGGGGGGGGSKRGGGGVDADGERSSRNDEGGGKEGSSSTMGGLGGTTVGELARFGTSRKTTVQSCTGIGPAVQVLVDLFVKAGGELSASRAGGTYSQGGRAVRVGLALALTKFLQLQSQLGSITTTRGGGTGDDGDDDLTTSSSVNSSNSGTMSMKQAIVRVLQLVGPDMEKQLKVPVSESYTTNSGGSTSPTSTNLFGTSIAMAGTLTTSLRQHHQQRSRSDPSTARLAACRCLRQGLAEQTSEPAQLAMMRDIVDLLSTATTSQQQQQQKHAPSSPTSGSVASSSSLNPNQIQVLLIELSHCFSRLGEAASSSSDDAVRCLESFLNYGDHGVRCEAALACASFASQFPAKGRQLLRSCLENIQSYHAELVTLSSGGTSSEQRQHEQQKKKESSSGGGGGLLRFRRAAKEQEQVPIDPALPYQYGIHGRSLTASLLFKDVSRLPGGVPTELVALGFSVAEMLASFQFNDALAKSNPGAVCTCVRSGFAVISGILSTGPKNPGVAADIALVFEAWRKAAGAAKSGGGKTSLLAPRHDLFCLDAVLSSIVVFLRYCSELLLSIPEALSQVTMILEASLSLFVPNGRFGGGPSGGGGGQQGQLGRITAPVAAHLESANSSLLEAFAWLPSGSFPMAADDVFALSARHIRTSVEQDIPCSILESLVDKEDALLDAATPARAKREGQAVGGGDLEETILSLTSEAVLHGEREAVLQQLSWNEVPSFRDVHDDDDEEGSSSTSFLGSTILGFFARNDTTDKPPTPLHGIGSWRRPFEPSSSGKVRLVDAAVQAFSTTFGLKSGKEQQSAMDMLESLVPPHVAHLANALGVKSSLTLTAEQERRNPKVTLLLQPPYYLYPGDDFLCLFLFRARFRYSLSCLRFILYPNFLLSYFFFRS